MTEEPSTKQPKFFRLPDYKTIYANQGRVRISQNEIQIAFGIQDELPDAPIAVLEQIGVVLPPQYAKILSNILSETIKAYESQFGIIRVPEGSQIKAEDLKRLLAKKIEESV